MRESEGRVEELVLAKQRMKLDGKYLEGLEKRKVRSRAHDRIKRNGRRATRE